MVPRINPKSSNWTVILSAVFGIAALVVVLGFLYRSLWNAPIDNNPKLENLEKSLQDIRAAMNVDSVRQFNIQKIMMIIQRYNNEMPSSMKYDIANEIYDMSVRYTGLDVELICATITHESGESWDPEITSDSGAMGLLQIMPVSGMWLAYYEGLTWSSPEEILFNPIYNIRIGCRNLASLIERYGREGGLAAFNGGEKKAATWLAKNKADGILWAETSHYIPRVLSLYEEFKALTL